MNHSHESLHIFYTFATEQASIGVHAVNCEGETIIYNQKMKEIEGLALEDVKDRSILELFNFNQEESTLLKVLQSGNELLNVKQTYWNHKGIEITTVNDTFPVFKQDKLLGAIELSRDVTTLEKFMHQPFQKMNTPVTFDHVVAVSETMKSVISTAKKAAKTQLPILLIGESGTGKEMIAKSIHHSVFPESQTFYTLHCQSATSTTVHQLLDSLENTVHYTLFCERIDLLSISLQKKLLAALSASTDENRQVIASLGEDPVELIASGLLLKDLYYFFSSFALRIPPLRKRQEDILPFANAYLERRRSRYGHSLRAITQEVEQLFKKYHWPGNFRELEFLLDEITSLTTTETNLTYEMLPLHFRIKNEDLSKLSKVAGDFIVQSEKNLLPLDEYLREAEIYYVEKAMTLHEGNVTQTAEALGMSRQNLQYRLRKLKK